MTIRSWLRNLFARKSRSIRKPSRGIRLGVEQLEDRTVPTAIFTVLNGADDGPGSLRAAIAAANDELTNPGHDDIVFAPAVTAVTLTSGQLTISTDVTITGPAGKVTVQRTDAAHTPEFRIFEVLYGATATLENLTIRNGRVGFGGHNGGGIYNGGTLTVTASTLSDNSAEHGGGIYNNSGTLKVTASTLSNNSADDEGGGIYNSGTLIVTASTLSVNYAHHGAGIYNESRLTVTASALSDNSAGGGGGIWNAQFGTVTVTASTLSGNEAPAGGGVIWNEVAGRLTVTASTLSVNSVYEHRGIFNEGEATLNNTIVAASVSGGPLLEVGMFNGLFAGSNNLIDDGSGGLDPEANLLNVDPLLGDLADNGGPTKTHALLPGSPAINAGDIALLPPDSLDLNGNGNITESIPFDQRGAGFNRVVGAAVDIGAFEGAFTINADTTVSDLTVSAWTVNQSGFPGTLAINNGTSPFTLIASSRLPNGLTAVLSGSSIAFTGTPTAAGTFASGSVTIKDTTGATVNKTFTITINPAGAMTVSDLTVSAWTVNQSGFPGTLAINNGTSPFTVIASSGLPNGLTAVLSGSSIAFTGTPTAAGTFASGSVTIKDATGATVNKTFAITINAAAAMTVVFAGTVPTFSWAAVPGAVSYEVWVDNVTTGQSPVLRSPVISATSWISSTPLNVGQTYRWWVGSFTRLPFMGLPVNTLAPPTWSTPTTLIVPVQLTPPAPISPTGSGASETPTFKWTAVTGPPAVLFYDIWVNNGTTGQAQVVRSTSTTTSLPITTLALSPGQMYSWWVRARLDTGNFTAWSGQADFTVAPLATPTAASPNGTTPHNTDQPQFTWSTTTGPGLSIPESYWLWVNRIAFNSASAATLQSQVISVQDLTGISYNGTLAPGHYRWWIGSVSTDGLVTVWSDPKTFTIAPTLVAPTNGSPAGTLTPTLSWTFTASLSERWDIWIDRVDNTTGNPLASQIYRNDNVTASGGPSGWSFTLPSGVLSANQRYRWWVRAYVNGTPGSWSLASDFLT